MSALSVLRAEKRKAEKALIVATEAFNRDEISMAAFHLALERVEDLEVEIMLRKGAFSKVQQ